MKIQTRGFSGYSVEYSPFHPNRLACAAGANFGLVGSGSLWVFNNHQQQNMSIHSSNNGAYPTHHQSSFSNHTKNTANSLTPNVHQHTLASNVQSAQNLFSSNTAEIPDTDYLNSSNTQFYNTPDALFDVAWSECCENQVVAGCGDGSVMLWDFSNGDNPIMVWREHAREVFAVNWNQVDKRSFCSSSWDLTTKIVTNV